MEYGNESEGSISSISQINNLRSGVVLQVPEGEGREPSIFLSFITF